MTDRDTMPLRGVYAKIIVCCPEMDNALEQGWIKENEWLRGIEAPSPGILAWDGYEEHDTQPISFCPWCGKKLEVEPEVR